MKQVTAKDVHKIEDLTKLPNWDFKSAMLPTGRLKLYMENGNVSLSKGDYLILEKGVGVVGVHAGSFDEAYSIVVPKPRSPRRKKPDTTPEVSNDVKETKEEEAKEVND
jgi:hypothetical protein